MIFTDHVCGDKDSDAWHWDTFVNKIFQSPEYADVLANLFNEAK
jgi:hypothetical protein